MGTASGELASGSIGPGGQASCWQTNQQPIHPFNRNHQRASSNFSQDEESVQPFQQKISEQVFSVKDDSLPLQQDSREDKNHFGSESEFYQIRASVDPCFANNTSRVSPASSPTNTGVLRQQSVERQDDAILHHEGTAPPSPRNNPFESRAARVARLKHVRPKVAHQSNDCAPKGTTNAARDDESDALSHCSSDIKKRLENSPLHKMMQQKRPQRTISASPPRSRESSHCGQEKPERISEKLKRIARSQSPAPLRVSGSFKTELRDGNCKEQNASTYETAHPVFGYTKNTVKSGRNFRIEAVDASNSPPRVQLQGHEKNYSDLRTSQSPPRVQNSPAPMHQERKGLDVEKNSHQMKRSTCPKQVAGRSHEHISSHFTNRGKYQNHEYRMVDLPSNALVHQGKSGYLDPTLLEVAMSDESTISTISHKYSAEADRRNTSGYQALEGSRPQQIQELSNTKRSEVDPSRSGHVLDAQKTRDQGNNQISRYQMVKGNSGTQNSAYNIEKHRVPGDRATARADDDIFEGLEDETLLNDTIFRFADDDDGYNQKDPPLGRNDNQVTKDTTRAPSSYVSKGGKYGRSGMVVEKTRGNKSVISDITSDLKSRKNREYRRKDYSGAEVATIDEKTDLDAESDVDETDIGGSRTVDDTVGYTVGEETDYQDSYEDESVIGINTQECTKELIMDSAFYKMGCAVVSSLSSVLPSQDVINQLCQDPRSCSQVRAGKNSNCNFLGGDDGFSGGSARAQEKTLQQVIQGLANSSDSSNTDPATKRARQDEERKQAQSKLLDYASQAMGRLSSTRHRQPQVLAPILSQTSQSGHGGAGTAFSVSAADDKTHSDNSSVLSVAQTKALTEVSASLRNEGVKCLKLNRHKKWQVRYLKVSQDGNTKCPKALLWLKNSSAPTTKLPDLKTNGQGGFLFSKLSNIETMQNTSLLDNLPRNLRKDFPSLQVVALDYDCDEGPRQVIISFKNSTEAEAFRSAVKVIKLWAQREGSSSLLVASN
jgi:hypothetical protein